MNLSKSVSASEPLQLTNTCKSFKYNPLAKMFASKPDFGAPNALKPNKLAILLFPFPMD